jgi:hypothetical protein
VHDGSTDRDETGRRILEAFADLQEHGVTATLAFVDDIPLSRLGKMNFFVSEMPGAGASGTTGPGVPGAGQGGA